ncbi:MAG: hypothetical protein QOC59_655, partial [Microbacteriaceae bacterium]|nr:hypothetical protein [Microbacteriaceae bacterium]
MTDTRSDAERLSAAIARFGLDRLVNDPELCRNVLSDLFPSDPLTAPLLAAAAAERVPTRLAADRGRIDAAVLIPQLGSALAAARGLRDDYAERAVRTWAAALRIDAGTGRDTAPTPPTNGDAPPAPSRENLVSEEHGRASPELETVTRESPPSPAPPAAPAPVPAPAPAAEREPPPALAARRRWPILVLAAAAVVLLVLTGVGIAIWRIASAVAGAPAVTVRTAAGAAGTITTSDTTKAIDGTQALQAGQTVTASKGLIEVNDARGVVMRLDAGAQVVYLRAATDKAIAQFELMTGRVYLNASGGRSVGVQSPAGDAEVGSGRL